MSDQRSLPLAGKATTFLRIGIANVVESTLRVAVIAMMVAALSQKTAARRKARAIRQE
jgi:hypothetical protein